MDQADPGELARAASAARRFGIAGELTGLPGERTANFMLDTGAERYLLKLADPADPAVAAEVDLAIAAMRHCAGLAEVPPVPPEITPDGSGTAVFGWLPGRVWADGGPDGGPHGPAALRDLGRAVARVDARLASFEHPALDRPLRWNLARAATQRALAAHVDDEDLRALATAALDRFTQRVAPRLAGLPPTAIHNDANDRNVLVDGSRVSGLIDFADVCRAPRICGLAVACSYAMLDAVEPTRYVQPLVAGYHVQWPLEPVELDLLLDLIRTRLALSVVLAAWQHSREPGNDYLRVSQPQVGRLLRALEAEHDLAVLCRWRETCGYEPHPAARQIRAWLAGQKPSPVLGRPAQDEPRLRFDLSAAVPDRPTDAAGIAAAMAAAGVRLGVGGYGEDRDVYTSDLFGGDERRTVHLGVDLFVPPGTDIYAPLDGMVEAVADNRSPQDYGPVIVVRHRTGDGVPFFTLYGHLSRDSLDRMQPGRPVWAGERIAGIGEEHENGGWPPHLHLQVLVDLFGLGTDVPGVARRSERELWQSICPDPNLLLGLPEGDATRPGPGAEEIAAQRAVRLSGALSLSYAQPLHIVRGEGAYLYDDEGRGWLDLVNNVAHVGHCHPRVVAAAAQQGRLNTNTRYLHASVVRYARRLAATLPDPLSVVFLVNSGSEANDLALRLAYAHTGGRDMVVLEGAYHGNLSSLVDVSPYKFDGPGGSGRPEHTHVVPLPDAYRGRHGPDPAGYLADLEDRIADATGPGRRLAGLLAEPIPGSAGQVILAAGFLAGAYRRIRAAGGVCIADEVQTGFGRVGSGFWAFEQHGVVPDVVTLGKPIGNGHPIGAVVTTPQVARSFDRGMEYFNTFGGNPVSAEIGLSVLDVLADERLQRQALIRGEQLLTGLRELAARHAGVGDVRGAGLFLGVELVAGGRRPDPGRAARVVEAAKTAGVLLSRDGIDQNVLKLKPPLVLDEADCRLALQVLDAALAEG